MQKKDSELTSEERAVRAAQLTEDLKKSLKKDNDEFKRQQNNPINPSFVINTPPAIQ
ncbi:MAG: hypothetical protein ABIN94_01140 [Ferruginibacter sp.]